MSEAAAEKVLSRKAQAARRAIEARGMSAEKALRRAFARTAEEAWNLAVIARNARIQRADQDRTIAALEAGDLILLLEGPDEALGFAVLDRAAVTALVEVQTLGIVTDTELDDRRLTPTDAAVAAPIIEGALTRLAAYLGADPLGAGLAAFRYGALVESPRIAANMLSASTYRLLEADLDMGGGLRQGRVAMALPEEVREPARPVRDIGPSPYEDLMLGLPAQVDAVLCRLHIPYAVAEGLKVGALLPLPIDALERAELVARGGHKVTRGRLGQFNGQRAIRVTQATGAARRATPLPEDAAEAAGALTLDLTANDTEAEDDLAPPAFDMAAIGGNREGEQGAEEFELPDLPPLDFDVAMGEGEGDDFPDFASAMGDLPDLEAPQE